MPSWGNIYLRNKETLDYFNSVYAYNVMQVYSVNASIFVKLHYIMPIRRLRRSADMGVSILTPSGKLLKTVNQMQKSIKDRVVVRRTLGIY